MVLVIPPNTPCLLTNRFFFKLTPENKKMPHTHTHTSTFSSIPEVARIGNQYLEETKTCWLCKLPKFLGSSSTLNDRCFRTRGFSPHPLSFGVTPVQNRTREVQADGISVAFGIWKIWMWIRIQRVNTLAEFWWQVHCYRLPLLPVKKLLKDAQ